MVARHFANNISQSSRRLAGLILLIHLPHRFTVGYSQPSR